MKVIFDDVFLNSDYALDPAAEKGRLDSILKIIKDNLNDYEIIKPESAKEEDILRAHTKKHLNYYKKNLLLYKLASFSVGGAIKAAEEAFKAHPSFAVIRPPGHYASSDSCWGFCYFNNITIALLKLFYEKKIKSAFILVMEQ